MKMHTRILAVSAAAVTGLLLTGCDNTDTEETPDAPAQTTMPMNDGGDGDDATDGGDGGDGDDAADGGDGDDVDDVGDGDDVDD